ncbi:hypothetical protein [Ekhidna sp. To15]|uniref:hypothetical protein n=1 Tax=Ekhidna sp. To15 TaxID=3395267 RepID=UPI003F523AA7
MKKKIVIASVLKPVDDVRAYWKLSQSIAKTNKYEVNIIGNEGKKQSSDKNIKFYPHSVERSNWLKRLLIREHILLKVLRIKPNVLIITTHELINTALVCKILLGCKVIYDVQENYRKNVEFISTSPFRSLISSLIYFKEKFVGRLFIDTYWLAESCYKVELSFIGNRYVVLENKAFEHSYNPRDWSKIHMVFSGTISEYGGVRRAIDLFIELSEKTEYISLLIIGQIHDLSLESWLKDRQKEYPELRLNISQKPISHEEILEAITQSNLGVIAYKPTIVNKDKIPTKLYEYSRYQLPFLVQKNTMWSKHGSQMGGAIPVDFSNIDKENILKILEKPDQLFPNQYPEEATWEFESQKLIQSLNDLMK